MNRRGKRGRNFRKKLVEKWNFKLYYHEELKNAEKQLVRFQSELDELRAQLVHIELSHPE